jgi:hypothetical protein
LATVERVFDGTSASDGSAVCPGRLERLATKALDSTTRRACPLAALVAWR